MRVEEILTWPSCRLHFSFSTCLRLDVRFVRLRVRYSRCEVRGLMCVVTEIIFGVAVITATGFLANGIFQGGFANLGSQDQCLGVKAPNGIAGRYCTVFWRPSTEFYQRNYPLTGKYNVSSILWPLSLSGRIRTSVFLDLGQICQALHI